MNIIFLLLPLIKTRILLNTTNHISIRGPITAESANNFLYESLTRPDIKYVYIDSPGGSVYHGTLIIDEIKQKKYICIADRAMSMGFAIFQSCSLRIIMETSELMQHQASLTINGELEKLKNWISMNDDRLLDLVSIQAKKINVSNEWFVNKTKTDWYMTGNQILKNNCADLLIYVSCTKLLTKTNITRIVESDTNSPYKTYLPKIKETYSKCPKIHEPIDSINMPITIT